MFNGVYVCLQVRGIVCGGNHIVAFVVREWLEDDKVNNCLQCKNEFSTFLRRVSFFFFGLMLFVSAVLVVFYLIFDF